MLVVIAVDHHSRYIRFINNTGKIYYSKSKIIFYYTIHDDKYSIQYGVEYKTILLTN